MAHDAITKRLSYQNVKQDISVTQDLKVKLDICVKLGIRVKFDGAVLIGYDRYLYLLAETAACLRRQ